MPVADANDEFRRWSASGAADLTGPANRAGLGPPDGFVTGLDRLSDRLDRATGAFGSQLRIDPLAEIALRRHAAGMQRQGRTSCGGASRLLRSHDGWVALALPRPTDLELVPALIEREPGHDVWSTVEAWCVGHRGADIVERATLLGLAVGELPDVPARARGAEQDVEMSAAPRPGAVWRDRQRFRVLDLSALWAGPLCARLLALAGCDVVKVESFRRPDGARLGPAQVYAHLNADKRSVALDVSCDEDRRRLARLIDAADVVIESSRARALDQWLLGPHHLDAAPVWVSITGHGRSGEAAHRVGFGDDAAVSAGLVATGPDGPWFCADAVADPLTGLVAATLVSEAVAAREPVHLDISLAMVASWFAGRTCSMPGDRPMAQDTRGPAPMSVAPLGRHTDEVISEWTS